MSLKDQKRGDSEDERRRETWDRKIEFALSLLGYAVGLGNMVRFPYLVQRNGGGSFLVPYFLCLLLCGIPLYYLEIVMGQSTRRSCLACWEAYVPALKGVGYCMVIISFISTFYYQVYMAWILYFLGASAMSIGRWNMPWTSCENDWNTGNCVSATVSASVLNLTAETSYTEYKLEKITKRVSTIVNTTAEAMNRTGEANGTAMAMSGTAMSAAEEYWQYHVLRLSGRIEDIGYPSWGLLASHCVCWVVMYFCLRKGVRSVGKVVWVTATSPYILILVFLVRSALLPGSMDGIKFYLTPNFETLKNAEVWILGFLQIFYTLGPGWGGIITMASYNEPRHPFQREALYVPVITCMTSFVYGFVVFSCAGYLAHTSGRPVQEAVSTGPGLAFITLPEVTSHLPAGPVWAFLFFLMMFMVGADSLFVTLETCASCIKDELPQRLRSIPLWGLVVINITGGVIFLTRAGMYWFQLLDWYLAAVSVFLAAIMECVGLVWIYGYDRLSTDIRHMVGQCPPRWLALTVLGVVVPVLLALAMTWTVGKLSVPTYGGYVFPDWSGVVGWVLAVSVVVPVPVYTVILWIRRRHESGEDSAGMWRPYRFVSDKEQVDMTRRA